MQRRYSVLQRDGDKVLAAVLARDVHVARCQTQQGVKDALVLVRQRQDMYPKRIVGALDVDGEILTEYLID